MDQSQDNQTRVVDATCERLKPLLRRSDCDKRPVALMVCGCAGSGKSTLSKTVIKNFPSFHRISFDAIIAENYGLYNIDYPATEHEWISEQANTEFFDTTKQLLSEGKSDIVLDRAFYAKEDRDAYKRLVEANGARWVLLFLKASREELWQRIQARRAAGVNADSALEISEPLLRFFYEGFEVPEGEGEIVIDTTKNI